MMDSRTLLSLAKYISTALTAGFGILGLLFEFKNKKTKRITVWGKVAVIGILGSALVSFISQYEEGAIQAREAAAATKNAAELRREIYGLQNPLKEIAITYSVDLPPDSPAIQSFTQQLQAGLTQFLVNPPIGLSKDPNAIASVSAWDGPGQPRSVSFTPGSPLLPRDQNDLMFTILRLFAFDVRFYKTTDIGAKSDLARVPDLAWGAVITPGDPEVFPYLDLNLKNKILTLGIYRVPIRQDISRSNGTLSSLPDLLGSTITVGINEVGLPPTLVWKNDYAAIIERSNLSRFEFAVGNQTFVLPKAAFKRVQAQHRSVYAYTMPATQAGLDVLRLKSPY
jgi:hypothetical protein